MPTPTPTPFENRQPPTPSSRQVRLTLNNPQLVIMVNQSAAPVVPANPNG